MKKSVCLSQDSNLGSQIYLYGLIQPIRGRTRVNCVRYCGTQHAKKRNLESVCLKVSHSMNGDQFIQGYKHRLLSRMGVC